MGKRKKRQFLKTIRKPLLGLIVAAIFIVPLYVTGLWLHAVAVGNDPRKLQPLPAFNVRPADKETTNLKPFEEPLVTVTFDDGWESTYTIGEPIMQRYGIHSTQFIITGVFNNPSYMSVKQLHAMQDAGTEIASHTVDHYDLTQLNDKDLHYELLQSKATLEKEFGPITDFASPLSAVNKQALAIIKQHYGSQRNTLADPETVGPEDVNTADNFNPYNVISYAVRPDTTLTDITKLLNYAQAHNAWVVLTYHQIDEEGHSVNTDGDLYSVTPSQFEVQMKLLREYPIRSATMNQVLSAVQRQKGKS